MLNTSPNRRDPIFNRVPGRADLDAGQLAVNTADGIVYTKLGTGQVVPIAGRSINGGGGTSFELPIATDAILGGIKVGSNLSITAEGVLSAEQGQDGFILPPATRSTLGGVIVGSRLSVGPDGTLSADAATLPIASPSVLGGVRVGSGLTVDAGGLLQATASSFTLPIATNIVLGGVKQGSGLNITADGTLSVPDDRVRRTGDTMTGNLSIVSAGASVTTRAALGQGGFLLESGSVSGGLVLDLMNASVLFGSHGVVAGTNAGTVLLSPAWGNQYAFGQNSTTFERHLRIRASGSATDGLQIGANAVDGRPRLMLGSRDFAQWWAMLDASGTNGNNVTLGARQELVLHAQGLNDPAGGVVLLRSNGASWTTVGFFRGNTALSWINVNGDLVRASRAAVALPSIVPADAGLAEVLKLDVVGPAITTSSIETALPAAMERHTLPATEERAEPEELVGVSDTVILSALVKAVQELTARIEVLESA